MTEPPAEVRADADAGPGAGADADPDPGADADADPDPDPGAGADAGPGAAPVPRARSRGRQTARDMVWSLAVVGVFVAFLVAVNYRGKPDPVRVVDPAPALAQARAQAAFVPVVPVGLPSTWRATSARYERAAVSAVPNAALWHLGYLTPTDAYAAVDQVEGDPTLAVRTLVEGARPSGDGAGTFAGWERWQTPDGRRTAYVLAGSASAVVVSGTADDRELATLADALRPPPAPAP